MATKNKITDLLEQWLQKIGSGESENARDAIKAFAESSKVDSLVKNLLYFLSMNISNHLEHVKAFNELAVWALGVVTSKNAVLNYFWNYVSILYKSKDLWMDLMSLIPVMAVEESEICSQHFEKHLNLTKYLASAYYGVNLKGYRNSEHLKVLLGNFSRLLKVSARENSRDFWADVNVVFDGRYRYGQLLIETDKEAGKAFLIEILEVIRMFSKQKIIHKKVSGETFVVKSDFLQILIDIDLKNDLKDLILSRKFLEIWREGADDLEMKCIEVLRTFCWIFLMRNVKETEKLCRDYQGQVEILGGGGATEEPLIVDTFATIALILKKHFYYVNMHLSVSAFMSMIRSITTQISIGTGSRKYFCRDCNNSDSKKHCIVTLIGAAVDFFSESVTKSPNVPTIVFESLVGVLKHNFYILGRFKCSQKDILAEDSMRITYNVFSTVKQKNAQRYVEKVMEIILENTEKFNVDLPLREFILKFLQNFYMKEQNLRQALNVGVLKLLLLIQKENLSVERISAEIKKHLHYTLYEFRAISPTNLLDVIEDESFKWLGKEIKFDGEKLLMAQIASYEGIGSKALYCCAINKLMKISRDPKIRIEAFIYLPGNFHGDFRDIFESFKSLLSKEKPYPDLALHKAFLNSVIVSLRFDEMKKNFAKERVTENEIIKQEWKILERIHVEEEKQMVQLIQESVRYFEIFSQDSPAAHKQINHALKIMKNLALNAKMYGLIKDSLRIYDLIYQIATKINHKEMIFTALANILFYSTVYEDLKSNDGIVNQLTSDQSQLLNDSLKNFSEENEKHQESIISCLLNYALFCASKGRVTVACRYLSVANVKIQSLESLKHMEIHFLAIEYLIAIKYSEKSQVSHVNFMPKITKAIQSSTKATREIVYLLPLEIIRQLVEYSVIRFDCDGVNAYVLTMLRYFLMAGLMLQVADVLLVWAQVDLAEEKVENCKSKLYYYMKILHLDELQNGNWVESWRKKPSKDSKAVAQTRWTDVESARTMFLNHAEDCKCLLCLQQKVDEVFRKIVLFFVWILFIEKQFEKTLNIYSSIAENHKRKSAIVEPYEMKTRCFIINSLMNIGDAEKSLQECMKSQRICESMMGHRTAFRQGFEVQIASLMYSDNRLSEDPVKIKLESPEEAEVKRKRFFEAVPIVPMAKVEFERRLEKCSSESEGSSENGRSPLERNLDAKFKGKINSLSVENKRGTRSARQVKEETVKKVPKKVEKKTTRSTKK